MPDFNFALPPIQRRQQTEAPLSPSQRSLWLIQQIDPNTVAYNSGFLFRLTGDVDKQLLELALNQLVQRHESLRTVYPSQRGEPLQIIQPFEPFSLPVENFSTLPEIERKDAIYRYAAENEKIPFRLDWEISRRFTFLQPGSGEDYLFVNLHHINFDAWSIKVFIRDLVHLYDACLSGEEPRLPELTIQYSDYAIAVNEWFCGETRDAFIEHWSRILSGELPILELPIDRPRQPIQTDHGDRHPFDLSLALSAQIKFFCRKQRITPFHFFVAVYGVLLMHYSNQDDILIGCPFANRLRPELENIVGLFVNVLPIRLNLSGDPSVRDLLEQVQAVVLDAFAWQALPFDTLVAELAPQRDLSRNPIHQAIINMRDASIEQESISGLKIEGVFRKEGPAVFDISFEFSDAGDHYKASVVYNSDLFEKSTILRMVTHFQNILEGMLAKPDRMLSELEILTPAELQQILVRWNGVVSDYACEKCVHQMIEEQVTRVPDSPAVIFGELQITYRELNERSNQIAHYLRKLGAGPEIPVGLYLERSVELVVAILGIIKAGSPYVPLDTLYPMDRRTEIIRDSGMRILVTQDSLITDDFASDLILLRLDKQHQLLETESNQNPLHISKPENLVYIIYTSGSTGKPKGVEVNHRSLVNCLVSANETLGLSAGDLLLSVSAPAFDVSVFDFLSPLCLGATVALASKQEIYDSVLLAKLITELPISLIAATPSTWWMLLETGWRGKMGLKIVSTGEALPSDLANDLLKINDEVYNFYGPTEATIWCSSARLYPGRPVTIGRPLANIRLYILDSHLRIAPVGVVGELYIGGVCLARGYHNRTELTAQKFISDPLCDEPGGRLFKTGDLARWLSDGSIEFLGRVDNQIKIRGFRIELGEIETVLGELPEVKQVLVVLREDQAGDKRLVAYIIPDSGSTLDINRLRSYLREKLPDYMVPSAFVQMDAFPLNLNSKIDRKLLPQPEKDTRKNQQRIAPRSRTEQTLSQIWSSVLGLPLLSLDDNFFDVGGNSFLAIMVIARIQHEFEIDVPARRIFEFPRLSELATLIDFELFYQKDNSGSFFEASDQEEFIL